MKAPFWFFQASVSIQLCVNEGEYSRLVAKRVSEASGTLPVLWTDHGTRKLARAIVGIEVVVIPREDLFFGMSLPSSGRALRPE